MSIITSKLLLIKNIFIKLLVILIVGFFYSSLIAYNKHNVVINNNYGVPGVCVFDIDYTLNCEGAYAAVEACKSAGFELAINTARNKTDAYTVVNDGTLINKGFSYDFVEKAKSQNQLNGPFQYRESFSFSQPEEQKYHTKSYGMRKIASYFGLKTNDIESRRIILFDDMLHNILKMQPNVLDPYKSEQCKANKNGNCYYSPYDLFKGASFPRNWKIYRSKWIGYLCSRWSSPEVAAMDAWEMIQKVLNNEPRMIFDEKIIDMGAKKLHSIDD